MMKILIFAATVILATQASAQYGIRPPVTGNPNAGTVSTPRLPETNTQPRIGIGDFEENQILAAEVLALTKVKESRVNEYREALVLIAQKDLLMKQWLVEVKRHFESDEFKNSSAEQKEKDRFEARMMIEMTIAHYGSAIED